MKNFKRHLIAGVAGVALAGAVVGVAQAQDHSFNLPAQSVGEALPELARQAGLRISAPTDHLSGVRAPAVQGVMDVDDALARLIAGTDLVVARREGSLIVLERRGASGGTGSGSAQVDDVVVVGSRIGGMRLSEALPVTVITSDDLAAIGAMDGDDLFRAISQTGDVGFNETDADDGGISNARGDVASLNLRSIGTGNTLALLNGRRLVPHPGTQVENFVPVTTVNTNAIPTMGIQRVEVLADGAAAIYGTDAVAGVVNTVLLSNFEGFTFGAGAGSDEGGLEEYSFNFQAGHTFNDGRTNISVMGDYLTRDALFIWERDYATRDGRVAAFAGRADGLDYAIYSAVSAWAEGIRLDPVTYRPANAVTRINGQGLTAAAGTFHLQPTSNPGCLAPGYFAGTCFDNSTLAVTGEDENLRYNRDTMRTLGSSVDRANLFTFINHRFDNGVEAFAEIGYYWAHTWGQREQDITMSYQRLLMSPTAYWNPLGAVGVTARLPGLTTGTGTTPFPAGGAALEIQDYRFADLDFRDIDVENENIRLLGGLRGEWRGFDWETAALYSKSSVLDEMDGISMTKLQTALNLTTPDAYNPFIGGDLTIPSNGRMDGNSAATIASILERFYRLSETELFLLDFKISSPNIYQLPGGDVGFAAGVEYRRETFYEDRDQRQDGTINYVDLTGEMFMSDLMGVSYTPDSEGSRDVYSAFVEFAIPIVSPEMNIPLVQAIDVQLAGRVEHYTLFGAVAAPKIAVSYRPSDWLMFRSSWSEGFRAPNLLQLHQPDFERSNSRRDYAACAVQLAIGAITSITQTNEYCTSETRLENRAGNTDLKPERSDNFTAGIVLEPRLWPSQYGDLTFTADYWQIEQRDLVGIMGGLNQSIMDYYLRQIGSSNASIVRAAPTQQQIDDATRAGLAPVGNMLEINDSYLNLQPRSSAGVDYRLHYTVRDTPIGDFRWSLTASHLMELYQEASEQHQMMLDGLAAGVISGVTVSGVEDLVNRNGRPEWKLSSTLTWSKDQWQVGLHSAYVGEFYDTSAYLTGTTDFWVVEDWLTHSLYVEYSFENSGWADGTRIRVGARNIEDKDPPLADERFGYYGSVHSNRGRWWYMTLRKSF